MKLTQIWSIRLYNVKAFVLTTIEIFIQELILIKNKIGPLALEEAAWHCITGAWRLSGSLH